MANQFQDVRVKDINVEIELSDKPVIASIEGIRIDKNEVKPGEDVNLAIILKPYGGEYTTIRNTITIPEDLPDGKIRLLVCDARNSMQMSQTLNPEKYRPHSFEQLVKTLEESEKNNEIAIRLFLPRSGVTVHGQELPSLPGSLVNIMSSSRQTGVGKLAGEIFKRIPTEWVISGSHQLELTVKRE